MTTANADEAANVEVSRSYDELLRALTVERYSRWTSTRSRMGGCNPADHATGQRPLVGGQVHHGKKTTDSGTIR